MTDFPHIASEDLALHVMRMLGKEEASVVEAHLDRCSACRQEYLATQRDLALVSLSADPVAPAPEARERFLQQIQQEKRPVSISQTSRNQGAQRRETQDDVLMDADADTNVKPGGRMLPWLGWAVAAGLAFSATSLYHERTQLQATVNGQSAQLKAETAQVAQLSEDAAKARTMMDALTDPNAMRVTLNTAAAAKAVPQGRASYVADKGALIFTANNLDPLPIAKVYELWIIPADGSAPVPAGTFHPDGRGNASLVMPAIPKGVQAKAFGVTMEAEGGATTPTMPILLAGA